MDLILWLLRRQAIRWIRDRMYLEGLADLKRAVNRWPPLE